MLVIYVAFNWVSIVFNHVTTDPEIWSVLRSQNTSISQGDGTYHRTWFLQSHYQIWCILTYISPTNIKRVLDSMRLQAFLSTHFHDRFCTSTLHAFMSSMTITAMPVRDPCAREWCYSFFREGEECCVWMPDPSSKVGRKLCVFRCVRDREYSNAHNGIVCWLGHSIWQITPAVQGQQW